MGINTMMPIKVMFGKYVLDQKKKTMKEGMTGSHCILGGSDWESFGPGVTQSYNTGPCFSITQRRGGMYAVT